MAQMADIELTTGQIRVLASLIYEPVPRVWIRGRWYCPFCLRLNGKACVKCSCGLAREAVMEESGASSSEDGSAHAAQLDGSLPDSAARIGFCDQRQPPPSAL